MLRKQDQNHIDFSNGTLVFPEQVDFYLQDKNDFHLIPKNKEQIIVPRGLKEIVKNSDLFTEEDKKQFVFQ